LSILVTAAKNKKTISECVDMLPARFTVSDRIQNFPREKSMMLIDQFQNHSEIEKVFGELFGRISKIDQTDGLRITFNSEDILHIRPSGNAPEFRCYNESGSLERALYMQKQAMEKLNTLKD
jgi:phosphomannomutase